jgi:hypothetical protein
MINKILFFLMLTAIGVSSFGQETPLRPHSDHAVYFDVSPPLKDMIIQESGKFDGSWKDGVIPNFFPPTEPDNGFDRPAILADPSLQLSFGPLQTDTTIQNFDGMAAGGSVPPDTYGEAGLNCYFQVVNTSFAIYNKSGVKIFGPVSNSAIWTGMPNNENSGDAVVHWDENAQRWLFTQFSLPDYPNGPFYQMIAISQTPDPTGSWYRYQYEFADMPDYPKFGIWPDGYYMSANRFGAGGWKGNGAYAYDRIAMLSGNPDAQRISFEISVGYVTLYPSDCDDYFPAAGTPNYFAYIKTNGSQALGIYEFHADFSSPSNSTFGNLLTMPVTSFNTLQQGITQKGTAIKLETLGDRLMYRLQYRVFNGYSAMVVNHSVNAGSNRAGVRWYELRKTSGDWTIYQQSTYAPADNNSRWMGSMAMDTAGTIALGYSVSGPDLYPAIRYTGRFKNDPLNQMTISEKTIIHGGGCQTGSWSGRSRWGDYSGMSVDPACPTTFWYTTEYYPVTSSSSWVTRIGSFTFGNVFSTSASASPAYICLGDSSQLEAIAYGGSGNYTYAWSSIPSGFTSDQAKPKVGPVDTTIYIVATSDGTTTRYDTAQVKVVFPPTIYAGEDTTLCSWAYSIPVNGLVSNVRDVRWGSFGDGHFGKPTSLNTFYIPGTQDKATGHVDLILTAYALPPCSGKVTDIRQLVIDPCTTIPEQFQDKIHMEISPNPADGLVNFTITGLRANALLTLTGMDGTVKASFIVEPNGQKLVKPLDVTDYNKGIYIIKLKSGVQVLTDKLVIR